MPQSQWTEAFAELQREAQADRPGTKASWAKVLYKRVKALSDFSGRPCVVYATACTTNGKQVPPGALQIDSSDKIGFYEVTHSLSASPIDLILHSPGGFPEAAESIVESLRAKFPHVRVIVPSFAKSAATMMAMSADEILLDDDAELGPIDPQMQTANGFSPAEAIKEQFLKAGQEISADPKRLSVWVPILQQMGPSMLIQCDNAIELSKTLVRQWLSRFMFNGDPEAAQKADAIAKFLGQHSNFRSHARCIRLKQLQEQNLGLKVSSARTPIELHRKIWDVYCAIDVIFAASGIFKLFFNSKEDAMIRAVQPTLAPMLIQQKPPV
ncbi:MAG: SDH family Clp fold serine proteinase [Bryobacteraceae bacterium]